MKPIVCLPYPVWLQIETDTPAVNHPLLELCLTSTKGLGLFAKQDIKRGTCILSEAPLIILPSRGNVSYHDLLVRLAELSPDKRDLFHNLHSGPQRLPRGTKQAIKYEAAVTRRLIRDDAHFVMEKRKILTFVSHLPLHILVEADSAQLQDQRNAHVAQFKLCYLPTIQPLQPRLYS